MSDETKIQPYDLSPIKNLYNGYLDDALQWWSDMDKARLERMPRREREHEMWLRSRRAYWRPLQSRLMLERVARIQSFVETLKPRHWESFERTLHNDCF